MRRISMVFSSAFIGEVSLLRPDEAAYSEADQQEGIALIPLALAPDQPGREILFPVATVIIGGLISSTLLDFLVRPALFWTFGKKEAERLAARPRSLDRASEEMSKEYDLHE